MVHESRDESENATDLMRSASVGQLTTSHGPGVQASNELSQLCTWCANRGVVGLAEQ
jgi:hypothetical protein